MSFLQQQQPFQGTTPQTQSVIEVDNAIKLALLREEIDLFFSSKLDVIRQNPFIVDFFNTMKKNLVDYHVDHLSRIEFNSNLRKIFDELIRVLSLFTYDSTGDLVPIDGLITGTTHNDFYKFTMAPVIAWVELVMRETVNVCFGTDIRENLIAEKLLKNHNGILNDVIKALNGFAGRKFNPDIVKKAVSGTSIQAFWDKHSNSFFGTQESPNTLIRPNRPKGADSKDFYGDTLIYNRPLTPADVADGGVAITVYVRPNAKHAIDPTQPPMKVYIEAMGPWGKSTFLETTMMQAVYKVALQHHLMEQQKSYGQWLYEAMFRCHLSMRHTQTECPISGALFSGRRTGNHALTLLQVLYLSRFQTGEGGVGKCIGTSSVDAWYTLVHQLGFSNIIPPVGTHAHELSMVFASLFAKFDTLQPGVPFSQALSHALYYTLVHQGHPVPMPMLTDTVGSEAGMIALASSWVQRMVNGTQTAESVRLLSVMTSARQDSGELEDFDALIKCYKSSLEMLIKPDLTIMASEIDDSYTMIKAGRLGYKLYGSGGYLGGDSEKAWPTTDIKFSASMAVKAVRVFVGSKREPFPIKLGDSENPLKITADTSMDSDEYSKLVSDRILFKQTAIQMVQSGCLVSPRQLVFLINEQTGEVVIYLNGTEIDRLIPRS